MRSRLFTIFLFASLFLFPKHNIFALQEFSTTLTSTYSLNSLGTTLVRNEIRIKNNFSTLYSTQYALEVSSTSLRSIRAYTEGQKDIPVHVTKTDTKTTIALVFSDKIIGKDKERIFFIDYEHPDAAVIVGKTLEIDIPKLAKEDQFHSYIVKIEVPVQFGNPSAAAPQTYTIKTTEAANIFTFTQGIQQGINMLFGEAQEYSFTLKYHLSNPSISRGVSQIALPPETPYQHVIFSSIYPKPDLIQEDEDGNWIATFTVDSQKEALITVQGSVRVSLKPSKDFPIQKPPTSYLSEPPYWEVQSDEVQRLAKQLKTPQAIYEYLVQTFTYDYERLRQSDANRRGAVSALAAPAQALCQEFTDTFIAIARAAGIPARELNGFAYTENPRLRPLSLVGDLLHAWPEYYDESKKMWIPIDPTWGNTTRGVDFFSKLDMNHIVFAIHGISSEKPFAAGMYKITGKEEKDVEVKVQRAVESPQFAVNLTAPTFFQSNEITIENLTGMAWYDVPVQIDASASLSLIQPKRRVVSLLPYQKTTVKIPVGSSTIFTQQKGTITVKVGNEELRYETTAGQINPAVAVGVGLGLCALIAGCILVFRRQR
ncbi:MAG: hypothetical protein HZA34_01705 [Candidatus Pacebacteria bacterium]|nr:hypothetical protein [Candidatus Paceibacterota bacterium]